MTTEQEKPNAQRALEQLMQVLIQQARDWGYVVTIETVPLQPLAMRNYEMVGDVRKAR